MFVCPSWTKNLWTEIIFKTPFEELYTDLLRPFRLLLNICTSKKNISRSSSSPFPKPITLKNQDIIGLVYIPRLNECNQRWKNFEMLWSSVFAMIITMHQTSRSFACSTKILLRVWSMFLGCILLHVVCVKDVANTKKFNCQVICSNKDTLISAV